MEMYILIGLLLVVLYMWGWLEKVNSTVVKILKRDGEALGKLIKTTELAAQMEDRLSALEKKIKGLH